MRLCWLRSFSILTLRSGRSPRLEGRGWPVTGAYLYILRCADDSFYVGTTRKDLEARIAEHNSGTLGGYTVSRRPAALAFAEHFEKISDAIVAERQIKGWSRAKKEALIAGDWASVSASARRRKPFEGRATPSFETGASRPPQDEVPKVSPRMAANLLYPHPEERQRRVSKDGDGHWPNPLSSARR